MPDISKEDLERACDDLAMLPFFPVEARASVMHLLAKICPSKKALVWVVAEASNHWQKWHGSAELRGLLCTRFDAADGVEGHCSVPGYTAADAEARYLAQHEQLKAGGWEAERLEQLAPGVMGQLRRIGASRDEARGKG